MFHYKTLSVYKRDFYSHVFANPVIYNIYLNDKKIYNKLPHMSCCLIQAFRPSGFFSVFTK